MSEPRKFPRVNRRNFRETRRNFRETRRNFRRNFRGNFRGNFRELVGILGYCQDLYMKITKVNTRIVLWNFAVNNDLHITVKAFKSDLHIAHAAIITCPFPYNKCGIGEKYVILLTVQCSVYIYRYWYTKKNNSTSILGHFGRLPTATSGQPNSHITVLQPFNSR